MVDSLDLDDGEDAEKPEFKLEEPEGEDEKLPPLEEKEPPKWDTSLLDGLI